MPQQNCACANRMMSDANSEDSYYDNKVDWTNDITESRHNTNATSASSDKIVFDFHFFETLYAVNILMVHNK